MSDSPTPSPQRKPRRRWRWHVPPALVHGSEALEGAEVLDEMGGAVGVVLWQAMRDVTLWGGVREPEERPGLFTDGAGDRLREMARQAGVDAALDAPLAAIAGMVDAPGSTPESEVMAACRQISGWADDRHPATSLAFAIAASVAAPANAAAAVRVGLLARERGEDARAETWFRRSVGLGRQAKDWGSYSEAFLGLGSLYHERGNHAAARRFQIRALRAARRHSLRELQGRALHDLFRVALDTEAYAEGQEMARAALRAFPPNNAHVPALALDLARSWVARGRFAPALQVLQAVAPALREPAERTAASAALARAAGGAGDRPAFEDAWDQVWPVAHESAPGPDAARALLDLGHGAALLGEWSRTEAAANAARQHAARREDAGATAAADALLDAARTRQAVRAPAEPDGGEESDTLAADVVRALGGGR